MVKRKSERQAAAKLMKISGESVMYKLRTDGLVFLLPQSMLITALAIAETVGYLPEFGKEWWQTVFERDTLWTPNDKKVSNPLPLPIAEFVLNKDGKIAVVDHVDCPGGEWMLFQLKVKSHNLMLGLTTVLQCLLEAEWQLQVPKLREGWWAEAW